MKCKLYDAQMLWKIIYANEMFGILKKNMYYRRRNLKKLEVFKILGFSPDKMKKTDRKLIYTVWNYG
jgi:hypothetical protein